MRERQGAGIPLFILFGIVVYASIFYLFVFIWIRVGLIEIFDVESGFWKDITGFGLIFFIQALIFYGGKRWQSRKVDLTIIDGAFPLAQNISYGIAFLMLYVISRFTLVLINDIVKIEYFDEMDAALSMNYVIGNIITARSWDVFVRCYFSK